MPKKFNVITIDAKRWFNRGPGNTYHSVAVYVDGKLIGVKPFQYGYGEQYLQTAHDVLQEAGFFPTTGESLASGMNKDYYEFRNYMMDNRGKFVVLVSDVSARKDLHDSGRWPKARKPAKRRTTREKSSPRLSVRGLR